MLAKSLILLVTALTSALSWEPPHYVTKEDKRKREGKLFEEYVAKRSYRFGQCGIILHSMVLILLMYLGYSPTDLKPWFVVCCAVGFLGALFRIWSMNTLGQFFTYTLAIRPGHRLVTTGPYRLLIHPSYTGMWFSILAFIISVNYDNGVWFVLFEPLCPIPHMLETQVIAVFILVTRLIWHRAQGEEKMMEEHFGAEWHEYVRARSRFIPFIF